MIQACKIQYRWLTSILMFVPDNDMGLRTTICVVERWILADIYHRLRSPTHSANLLASLFTSKQCQERCCGIFFIIFICQPITKDLRTFFLKITLAMKCESCSYNYWLHVVNIKMWIIDTLGLKRPCWWKECIVIIVAQSVWGIVRHEAWSCL